jgi:hypothetical protein
MSPAASPGSQDEGDDMTMDMGPEPEEMEIKPNLNLQTWRRALKLPRCSGVRKIKETDEAAKALEQKEKEKQKPNSNGGGVVFKYGTVLNWKSIIYIILRTQGTLLGYVKP